MINYNNINISKYYDTESKYNNGQYVGLARNG